ncbi:MAG TPA: hypothetical protein VLT36_13555, partial [Candidatus Dormibacteraeota bacterium]|nr:hypothetical protein [Candidatus Dormibacteraeota bacterium]
FAASRAVTEWGWDLKQLVRREHPWRPHQWVSSGFDELRAQQVRGRTFEKAESQESAGSIDWLRSLHQSHSPRKGPFSTCMHREDAVTVSYTEVGVLANRATMKHVLGAPCSSRQVSSLHLRVSQNLGE